MTSTSPSPTAALDATAAAPWWRGGVCYEVYVRSFCDSDGDGVGDLRGVLSRLDHLAWLGVDAIWLTPFYPSPGVDHGYDVSDPRAVDPALGSLDDFRELARECHARGIHVLVDVVPNHTSDQHRWFRNALSHRDHPDRRKYLFRDPAPDGGPPTPAAASHGGPAWTWHAPTGQYYMHLFSPEQPDLDWRNPAVRADMETTLRFWLDQGADGFRIDCANLLYKSEDLSRTSDLDELHELYAGWRRILEEYGEDKALVAELWLPDATRVARYLRGDELHLVLNHLLLGTPESLVRWTPWDAQAHWNAIQQTLTAVAAVAGDLSWGLSSHDAPRQASRYGSGEQARRRARAAALLLLALPGAVFLYQGEELGLEMVDLPDEFIQDPIFRNTRGAVRGRDGCRVPVPWNSRPPGFGFTTGTPWLPMPDGWGAHSVERGRDDDTSTLHLYRAALALRRKSAALRRGALRWRSSSRHVLCFERDGDDAVTVAVNFGSAAVQLPMEGSVVLGSDPGATLDGGLLHLPGDAAAWVAQR